MPGELYDSFGQVFSYALEFNHGIDHRYNPDTDADITALLIAPDGHQLLISGSHGERKLTLEHARRISNTFDISDEEIEKHLQNSNTANEVSREDVIQSIKKQKLRSIEEDRIDDAFDALRDALPVDSRVELLHFSDESNLRDGVVIYQYLHPFDGDFTTKDYIETVSDILTDAGELSEAMFSELDDVDAREGGVEEDDQPRHDNRRMFN